MTPEQEEGEPETVGDDPCNGPRFLNIQFRVIRTKLCIMCLNCLKKDLSVFMKGYMCNFDFMQGPFYSYVE